VLGEALADSRMLGSESVRARLPEIYSRFVTDIDPPAL
jgi:hypothetical protein